MEFTNYFDCSEYCQYPDRFNWYESSFSFVTGCPILPSQYMSFISPTFFQVAAPDLSSSLYDPSVIAITVPFLIARAIPFALSGNIVCSSTFWTWSFLKSINDCSVWKFSSSCFATFSCEPLYLKRWREMVSTVVYSRSFGMSHTIVSVENTVVSLVLLWWRLFSSIWSFHLYTSSCSSSGHIHSSTCYGVGIRYMESELGLYLHRKCWWGLLIHFPSSLVNRLVPVPVHIFSTAIFRSFQSFLGGLSWLGHIYILCRSRSRSPM